MSTKEYLSTLDLDQLKFAKEEAERRIREIEDQARVSLFIVEGASVNEACYSDNEFHIAKQKLCEVIMQDDFTKDDLGNYHPKIVRRRVYESEVVGWMGLNE